MTNMKKLLIISILISMFSCSQKQEVVRINNNTVDNQYSNMSYSEMMLCKKIDSWTPEQKELFIKTFVYTKKDIERLDSLLKK